MLSSQVASLEPPIHAVTNSKHRDYHQCNAQAKCRGPKAAESFTRRTWVLCATLLADVGIHCTQVGFWKGTEESVRHFNFDFMVAMRVVDVAFEKWIARQTQSPGHAKPLLG